MGPTFLLGPRRTPSLLSAAPEQDLLRRSITNRVNANKCPQNTVVLRLLSPHLMAKLLCLPPLRPVFPWAFAPGCEHGSVAGLCLSPASPRLTAGSWPWHSLLAARRSAVTRQIRSILYTGQTSHTGDVWRRSVPTSFLKDSSSWSLSEITVDFCNFVSSSVSRLEMFSLENVQRAQICRLIVTATHFIFFRRDALTKFW